MLSQSWHNTLILPAREIMFHVGKRVVISLDLTVSMNFEVCTKTKWFHCHATVVAFMTPPRSTGAMIFLLEVSPIQYWHGLPWQVEHSARDEKTDFASGFSLIVASTPLMASKTFASDKDALWVWSTRVTSVPIQFDLFLGLDHY